MELHVPGVAQLVASVVVWGVGHLKLFATLGHSEVPLEQPARERGVLAEPKIAD